MAGITAILAAAVLTACGGSKPEKDDTSSPSRPAPAEWPPPEWARGIHSPPVPQHAAQARKDSVR